jgi:hypothetical protein
MKKLDMLANDIIYGDMVHKLAAQRNIGLTEARALMAQMSFVDYRKLSEDNTAITPPSGQTIGPSATGNKSQPATSAPTKVKSIWPGKGAPVEVGMTVGVKGPNGVPVPGEVSQVDMSANGVKIKNPTTGEMEWMNTDTLEPFLVGAESPGASQAQKPAVDEDNGLNRILELAGIRENASSGATGAGAIAVAPAAMGGMKRRQPADEALKAEYTPKQAAKTIVGDTKPAQASGKLSADLAASGKVSAGRTNNGRKRVR